MKRTLLVLFFTLTVQLTFSQGRRFTLEQCIDYAMSNNFDQRSLEIGKELREVALKQAKNDRLMDLSASTSQSLSYSNRSESSSYGGSYSLGTNVILYNGGALSMAIQQSKIELSQSQIQIIQAQKALTINIIQAYLSVLMSDELFKFQQEALKSSEQQLAQGEIQFRAQKIIESDYMLLQSQYSNDKYNEINTLIRRNNALLDLKSLLSLGREVELEVVPVDTNLITKLASLPELNDVVQRSLAWSPDLKLFQQSRELAQLATKMSKSAFYPSISLGAGISTGNASNGGNFGQQIRNGLGENVGLSVSVPIFSKGRVKTNIIQSIQREKQAELDLQKSELAIANEIEQQYRTVVGNYAQFEAFQIKQNAYKESFRVYGEKFKTGSITVADLIIQQNSYLSAVSDLLQSKYSFILNRKIIDVYMGLH